MGVQSDAMTDAAAATAPSRRLPPLGAYLRELTRLGLRSIPAAVPALVFLWFYHFGTALYLELAGQGTTSLGHRDSSTIMTHALMKISAYLPLLVLVYTPFLPLQDSLLRGESPSFFRSIRIVLERMVPFIGSVVLQILIVIVPVAIVTAILVAVVSPFPTLPREVVLLITVATIVPVLMWLLLSSFFLVFAIPGVILSDLGAKVAISASARLVGSHFFGLFGRFLAFFVVLFVVVFAASLPAGLLAAAADAVSGAQPAFRMAALLWNALVTALTFPFWVGALLVLYRALVPAPETQADAAVETAEGATSPIRPHGGEHPTPFLFE